MSDEKDEPPSGEPPSGSPPSGDPPSDEDVKALVKRALASAKAAKAPVEAAGGDAGPPSSEDPPSGPPSDDPGDDGILDEVDLKDALRGALRPPPGSVAPSLLRGVQRKLRVRSRGKFYGDGWSTAPSPRSTYLISSILMLLLVAFVFFALVPWSSTSLP